MADMRHQRTYMRRNLGARRRCQGPLVCHVVFEVGSEIFVVCPPVRQIACVRVGGRGGREGGRDGRREGGREGGRREGGRKERVRQGGGGEDVPRASGVGGAPTRERGSEGERRGERERETRARARGNQRARGEILILSAPIIRLICPDISIYLL